MDSVSSISVCGIAGWSENKTKNKVIGIHIKGNSYCTVHFQKKDAYEKMTFTVQAPNKFCAPRNEVSYQS